MRAVFFFFFFFFLLERLRHPGSTRSDRDAQNAPGSSMGTVAVTASVAEGPERDRLWKLLTEVWPDYDEYQAKTDRQIPVVVLERA